MTILHVPKAVYYYFAVKLRERIGQENYVRDVAIPYIDGDAYILRGSFVVLRHNNKIVNITATWFEIESYVNGEQIANDAVFHEIKNVIVKYCGN